MKWTMKNGQQISIRDMADSHLRNTIKMLERKASDYESSALSCRFQFNGEMAQVCADQEFEDVLENGIDPAEICPGYDHLVAELQRRQEKKAYALHN